ncbi:MAG: hypothetical protein JXP72_07370, partial [Coriobacteriia bacterium]|nr:hypothetical protein [Coriobacteriia bacterium]
EPEPEPEPEPELTWVTLLGEKGIGSWMSDPFDTSVPDIQLEASASSPAPGNITFLLRQPGMAAIVLGRISLTPSETSRVFEVRVPPGQHQLVVDCPDGCRWAFKLRELR